MGRSALIVQNDDVSGPGTLEQALHDLGWRVDLWLAHRDPRRDVDLEDHDAVLAFGGRADPRQEAEWLARERRLIGEVLDREMPYLGVCLGGELLAQVAGGGAPTEPQPTQIEWMDLEATGAAADDPLLHDAARPVFEFHYNGIQVPAEATVLARREGVDQAFRVGERAWGVQFHLEVDLDMIARLMVETAGDLHSRGTDPNALRRRSAELAPAHVAWAREVVSRFVSLAG